MFFSHPSVASPFAVVSLKFQVQGRLFSDFCKHPTIFSEKIDDGFQQRFAQDFLLKSWLSFKKRTKIIK